MKRVCIVHMLQCLRCNQYLDEFNFSSTELAGNLLIKFEKNREPLCFVWDRKRSSVITHLISIELCVRLSSYALQNKNKNQIGVDTWNWKPDLLMVSIIKIKNGTKTFRCTQLSKYQFFSNAVSYTALIRFYGPFLYLWVDFCFSFGAKLLSPQLPYEAPRQILFKYQYFFTHFITLNSPADRKQ